MRQLAVVLAVMVGAAPLAAQQSQSARRQSAQAAQARSDSARAMRAPQGWIGIAFSCTDCSYRNDDEGGLWSFGSPPEVYSVEPGSPAYAAGIRRGDLLTHVGDLAITTVEGGRRWARIRPNEEVRLRYTRGGAVRTAGFVAAEPRGAYALSTRARLAELEEMQARLALRDSTTAQVLERNARFLAGQQAYREDVQRSLELSQQLEQLRDHLRNLPPEKRQEAANLLQSIVAQRQMQDNRQNQLMQAMSQSSRLEAERVMASRDSAARSFETLRSALRSADGQERLRYSGNIGGTDVEVRGVSPVVVEETSDEVVIRIGDAVVRLKRTRH